MANAQPRRGRKVSNFILALICIVMVVAFTRLIAHQSSVYNDRRARYEHFDRQLAEELAITANLRYQIANFDSDAYIERLARERLGWARPHEIIFRQRAE